MPIQESVKLVPQSTRCGWKAPATAGMVLECNDRGALLKIRRDDLGLFYGIAPGIAFHHLVERGSLDKAFAFLTELKKRGSAFGWELQVSPASLATTLYVGGIVQNGLLLIFGTRTRGGLLRFSQHFLDKVQGGVEAEPMPEPIPLARISDARELALQEQLICKQNQLANLKEVLARKSIRLKQVIAELKAARAGLHTLQSMLPICSSCKKIRDEQGYWQQVEKYFKDLTGVQFTHSICPECAQNLYPGLSREK
ncbi:MAG: hypothetical protein ACYC6G_01840 [Desulfobaccales bacterium]